MAAITSDCWCSRPLRAKTPAQIARHVVQYRWELSESLDTWIARLPVNGLHQVFSESGSCSVEPTVRNGKQIRKGGCTEYLRHERIRIKGDWRDPGLQLVWPLGRSLSRTWRSLIRGLLRSNINVRGGPNCCEFGGVNVSCPMRAGKERV